ncbi:MAG TPA: phenylalanine--tRNA ligase subunit beta [Paenalcaligenes sp.]|nr:phenylalanine--tRNA ligase subunit beta [Paenalcaligenes sp.]
MFVPESWLRSYVNPSIDTDTLCHKLTMAGLEVEEYATAAPQFKHVVVAEITSVEPHPDADRLRVCMVDAGEDAAVQIVCGAPNARVGLKAPLAKVDAELPGGFQIKPVKMRGVSSYGMLCSAQELGISDDAEGLLELPSDAPVGECLRTYLDLDEHVIEVKMTPNRADCLSVIGVAREVAALTDEKLQMPSFAPVALQHHDTLPVHVRDSDLCGRFAGRIVRNVDASVATPDWMVRRLERAGQRSLSVLVDISNYVLLELGRPTHVFDLDKLGSDLEVRWAKEGEKLVLLNGQQVSLNSNFGVICSDGRPQSLAGIMGGEHSAVNEQTKNIYIEAAFWWPESIRGRARDLKFQSEASYRFERGVDAATVVEHIERMTHLIVEICGGEVGPIDDQILEIPAQKEVSMRHERCERILGIPVAIEEIKRCFDALDFTYREQDGVFHVIAPSYRFDINIEEDLIEEVARIVGFERIPDVLPIARTTINVASEESVSAHDVRARVASLDYQEVVNFSFVDEQWEKLLTTNQDPIRLLNPIASQLSVMRSSLLGGLIQNIQYNARRRQSRIRIFEIGRVFWRDSDVEDGPLTVAGVNQPMRLAGAAWGEAVAEQWGTTARRVDFFDVKADLEALFGQRIQHIKFIADEHPALHPGRSARLEDKGHTIGWLGELHPQWVRHFELSQAPILFELDLEPLLHKALYTPTGIISRQPVVQRDLAFWVDTQVNYQEILDCLNETIEKHDILKIVQEFRIFDIWKEAEDANEQSLAMRFWLQDAQKTLADEQVDECMKLLFNALETQFKARLRA